MTRPLWWLVLIPCLLGCGAPASSSVATYAPGPGDAATDQGVPKVGEPRAEEVSLPTAGRQIIYRATIVLDVKDFAETERRVAALIKTSGGFVAQFREERPYQAVEIGLVFSRESFG